MKLVFRHSRSGVFVLSGGPLATMRSYEQHQLHHKEAGGILLGRMVRDGHDIIVDRVTVPMIGDRRERRAFHRRDPGHQAAIDLAWQTSGGTSVFLGDWHTHAEPSPNPSQIDLDNWKRMLREDVRYGEACFMVIVGQRSVRVWEGNAESATATRLEQEQR